MAVVSVLTDSSGVQQAQLCGISLAFRKRHLSIVVLDEH